MMRTANVYMHGRRAGWLVEDHEGYHFSYDPGYLQGPDAEPVSLTLPLTVTSYHMHPQCSRRFYGVPVPPLLPYTEDEMAELAGNALRSRLVVPGVQPKLSLDLDLQGGQNVPRRLTMVGLWGDLF